MDTSVLLNWIFGGGLLAALTALCNVGPHGQEGEGGSGKGESRRGDRADRQHGARHAYPDREYCRTLKKKNLVRHEENGAFAQGY